MDVVISADRQIQWRDSYSSLHWFFCDYSLHPVSRHHRDSAQRSVLVDSVMVMDKKRMVWTLTVGMEVDA